MKRLPQYAERTFAALCSEHGAICNKSDEDETGWDFLVEFPDKTGTGPADTRPSPPKAYVQVKSTRSTYLSCRIKLSNALIAARSQDPWFLVLVFYDDNTKSHELYAIHIWEKQVHHSLKAVRNAEKKGVALNKREATFRFIDSEGRTDDLLSWMRSEIEAITPNYENRKKEIYQSIGYEGGTGTGKLTVRAESNEEFFDNILGLGDGLKVLDFKFFEKRFGIEAPMPTVDVKEGLLHITPSSSGECELRFRKPDGGNQLIFPGQLYTLGLPGLPAEEQRFRFSAGPVEVVQTARGKGSSNVQFELKAKYTLGELVNLLSLCEWLQQGEVDLQIWSDGDRFSGGLIGFDTFDQFPDWGHVARIARVLASTGGDRGANTVKLSISDLVESFDEIRLLQQAFDAPFLRTISPNHETLGAKVILFYVVSKVDKWIFFGLFESHISTVEPPESDKVVQRWTINSEQPKLIDSYVVSAESETDDQLSMMQSDYERRLTRLEETSVPMGFGNLAEFLETPQ